MKKIIISLLLVLSLASRTNAQQILDSITAANDTVRLNPGVTTNTVFVGISGTWTATLVVEFLPVNSTTWAALSCINLSSLLVITSTSSNANLACTNLNFTGIRVRASAYTSGTATVAIRGTGNNASTINSVSVATGGVGGSTTEITAPVDANGNVQVTLFDAAGNPISLDVCNANPKVFTPVSVATSSQLITGTASKKIYICSIVLNAGAAENFSLVAGTGSVCGTNTVAVLGGTTAATGIIMSAAGHIELGNGSSAIAATTVNADNLCILQAGSVRIAGVITSVVQ